MMRDRTRWTARLRRFDIFDLGVSALLALIAMYLLPLLWLVVGPENNMITGVAKYLTPRSVIYSILGIAAFAFGYWGLARLQRRAATPAPRWRWPQWNERQTRWLCLGIFAAGFGIKFVRILSGAHFSYAYSSPDSPLFTFKFLMSLNTLHFIALAIAFTRYYTLLARGEPATLWKWIAWTGFVIYPLCILLAPGGRLAAIIPVLVFLITRHYLYRRVGLRLITLGLITVMVLFPLKTVMKDLTNLRSYVGSDNLQVDVKLPWNGRDAVDLAYYSLMNEGHVVSKDIAAPLFKNSIRLIGDSTIGRISQAHVFAIVVEGRQQKPLLYGKTLPFFLNWLWIPNEWIQRAMGISGTDDFAYDAGLVGDTMTGIGWTAMGDWYQNFGLPGVVLGMMAIGMAFRWLFTLLTETRAASGIFIYSILWATLLHGLEQSLASAIGESIRIFMLLLVIQWCLGFQRWPRLRRATRPVK